MSIIRDAIDRITQLARPLTTQVGEDTYTTEHLHRVEPHVDRPERVSFSSLDGVVKAITTEVGRVHTPLFVHIEGHDTLRVFTTYRPDNMKRDSLYTVSLDEVNNRLINGWQPHNEAIISLQSQFVDNEDLQYLLSLLKRVAKDNNVSTEDNGVTQSVTARQGVSLAQFETVRSRVTLRPFRTFLEVEQPASEFLLRVRDGEGGLPEIRLFEADGGAWKLEAKYNIAVHLGARLSELVESGTVVIAE